MRRRHWKFENIKLTCYASQELAGKLLNVMTRERREVVFLEEVVHTHTQKFRNQTNMVSVIEPAKEVDTITNGLYGE